MSSCLMWLAAVVAVSTAAIKLARDRRALSAGTVHLCGALGCIGTSAALAAPATLSAARAVEPFPDATRVLANVLAMVAAFCVYGMLAHLVHDPTTARSRVRRQAVVLAAAAVALTVLRPLAPVPTNPEAMGAFADEPAAVAYVIVFSGHIAANTALFILLVRRYLRYIDRPWLRSGLIVIQLGAGTAVVWAGFKITAALCMLLTGHPLGVASSVSSVLPALCITLVAVGTVLPGAGPVAALPLRRARMYRHHRRMGPLWRLLADAVPEITSAVDAAQPSRAGDVPTRLTRRVVEIRDGLLFTAPFRDPAVTEAAEETAARLGLAGDRRDALVAAAEVVAAANARKAGQPPLTTSPGPPRRQPDTFTEEVAWLGAVAGYCHHPALADCETVPKDNHDAHA